MKIRALYPSILLVYFFVISYPCVAYQTHKKYVLKNQCQPPTSCCQFNQKNSVSHDQFERWGGTLIYDVIKLNLNLLSTDSIKIISSIFPVYIGARIIDEDLQCRFFSHKNHKNRNQFPHWCHEVARYGVGIPAALLGGLSLLSHDEERQTTGWVYLLGFPFVIFGKDILKKAESDCNYRPWHEDFCKNHKRCLGGFPSGHMAEAVYTATLFGMRYGPAYAIPLSVYAAGLGMVFLNCNRHYLSQFVGGVGLGVMYAVAANKLIDEKLSDSYGTAFWFDKEGNPALSVSCQF